MYTTRSRAARALWRVDPIDGSPHDWFEGRGDYCHVAGIHLTMPPDVNTVALCADRTTLGYMHVLHDHILGMRTRGSVQRQTQHLPHQRKEAGS